MWLAFSRISCKLCLLLCPLLLCVDCLRGGMNHFLLERSMRKGEKRIALSLADCDRRHGRSLYSGVCLILGQSLGRSIILHFDFFIFSVLSHQVFTFYGIVGRLNCAEKCPYRREGGRASFHIGRARRGRKLGSQSRSAEQI